MNTFRTIVEFHPETGSKRPWEVYTLRHDGVKRFWASFATEAKAKAKATKNDEWLAREGILTP